MKNFLIRYTLLMLLVAGTVSTVSGLSIPEKGFEGDWAPLEEPLVFIGQDLFSHINGGAEVYHEYGFDSLIVQYYANADSELALEIYRMSSPYSALGIFLFENPRIRPLPGTEARSNFSQYQITLVRGTDYIKIHNFDGNADNVTAMTALAHQVLASIPVTKTPDILILADDENKVEGSERLFIGQYTLRPIFDFGIADPFNQGGKYWGVAYTIRDEDGYGYTKMKIAYDSGEQARAALSRFAGLNLPFIEIIENKENRIILTDELGMSGSMTVSDSILSIIIDK